MRLRIFLLLVLFSSSSFAQSTFHGLLSSDNLRVDHITYTLELDDIIGACIAGQSNGYGFNVGDTPSTTPVDLQAPMENVFVNNSGSWQQLNWPINDYGDDVGSILTTGYYLEQTYDRPVYLDVLAVSGAPVAAEAGRQDFNISTAELFPQLLTTMLDIQNKIIAENRDPFMVLVWIQGERDAGASASATAYRDNVDDVVNELIIGGVQLKAVVMNILNDDLTSSGILLTDLRTVQNHQLQFINQNEIAWPLDMNLFTLGADFIHYPGAQQELIGIESHGIITNFIITDVETDNVTFADVLANMNTAPAAAYETAMENFYDACVAAGIWDKMYEVQCRGLDTEANSLRGWKGRYNATNTGTATHVAKQGFNYDGTADYVNTGFIANTAPRAYYDQNKAGVAVYCLDNQSTVAGKSMIGVNDASGDRISMAQNAPSNLLFRINQGSTSQTYTGQTSFQDNSFYSIRRTAAGAIEIFINGVSVQTGTVAASGLPDIFLAEGAFNTTGTLSNFFDGIISLHITYRYDMDQAAMNTAVQNFITELLAIP